MRTDHPSLERVRELFHYDALSGRLIRRITVKGGGNVGDVSGSPRDSGHLVVGIDYKVYSVHHIVWFLAYGLWPTGWIDHRDGDPANNRLRNLRIATPAQNAANCKRYASNTSGYKGVSYNKRRQLWVSRLQTAGKALYLGAYPSPEMAYSVYCLAARDNFGEFARVA
jgi:hypothetical protein